MARRALAFLLLTPLLMAAKPQPSGTLTLTSTSPVTFRAETTNIPRTGRFWVSTSCFDALGTRTYYGEEFADANGDYIMDDTVWVLWIGTVAEGTCRGLLIYRNTKLAGPTSTSEVVLDDSGWFTAP